MYFPLTLLGLVTTVLFITITTSITAFNTTFTRLPPPPPLLLRAPP